jgi:hypothetical protein
VQGVAAALLFPLMATFQVWRTPAIEGRPLLPLRDLLPQEGLRALEADLQPRPLVAGGTTVEIQPETLASQLLLPLALPLLLVGVLFTLSWRPAWVGALLLQVAILAFALTVYFRYRPVYVYPTMLYGIVMVLYLNHSEVRQIHLTPRAPQPVRCDEGGGAA